MLKKFLPLLIVPLLLAGCATTSMFHATNLTPLQQIRTTNNLYTIEVAVASYQQSLRWDSIKPQIIVGTESYPMRPTLLMTNRWEGVIPVAPTANAVHYHYNIDFDSNAFGAAKGSSYVSPDYTLHIVEPQP